MESDLRLRDFYVGAKVTAWWVSLVGILIAAWPVLGLAATLASTGVRLRGSSVGFYADYKMLKVEVHTPRSEYDVYPCTCFVVWVGGTGLWVMTLLRVLGCF